jgi:outer membrane protein assembly factor BamB
LFIAVVGGFSLLSFGLRWIVMQRSQALIEQAQHPANAPANASIDKNKAVSWSDEVPPLLRGDGTTLNIAGEADLFGAPGGLVLLDGASGKALWRVPVSGSISLYANGVDVLVSSDPNKRIVRYDAKTGAKLWTVQVNDHVHEVTFGPRCVMALVGQTLIGLDAATGAVAPCKPSREPRYGRYRNEPEDLTFELASSKINASIALDNKPVNPEPARFAVTASRGSQQLWRTVPTTLEPVWTSDGFHRSMTLTPAGVFVYGRNASDHTARWLLIDAASGRILYQQQSSVKVETRVRVAAAGPLVYVVHDRRLDAFQASTGALVWSASR